MSVVAAEIPESPSALYLSHGGGPLPLLGDDGHNEMVESLTMIAAATRKPTAIIMVSAHWEDDVVAVTHAAQPPIIYDYYGFPKAAYQIQYPAPGDPALAERIHAALTTNQIKSRLDGQRGFDHGLYVPLLLMYPSADIPCVQVSLVRGLDPSLHIRIGEALAEFAQYGALIIGSGFSFHNMQAFSANESPETKAMNFSFEDWLIKTCASRAIDEDERLKLLTNWEDAPAARFCHPREEHLLPLHVCYGVNRCPCSSYMELSIINRKSSMYVW